MTDADVPIVLSVVIPCLNVESTLGAQLDALAAEQSRFGWQVVVVDNGSTDETLALAESYRDRLPGLVIVEEASRGRQFACNAGARACDGSFLAFVDGDDEIQPGFVDAMIEALERHDMVAGSFDNIQFADGEALHHGDAVSDALMDGYGFLPFASGGGTGIRASVFAEVGGFEPEAHYCEDTALSWRVQLAGYTLGPAPGVVVAVRQRSTMRSVFRQHRNFGVARVWLYREFATKGMPRRTRREVIGDWRMMVTALLFLKDEQVRTRWIRRLGRNVGFITGSFRYRTLFL